MTDRCQLSTNSSMTVNNPDKSFSRDISAITALSLCLRNLHRNGLKLLFLFAFCVLKIKIKILSYYKFLALLFDLPMFFVVVDTVRYN